MSDPTTQRLRAQAARLHVGIQATQKRLLLERSARVLIAQGIQPESPYVTGDLYKSNRYEASATGDYARVWNTQSYAVIVEQGRGAVVAKTAKALAITLPGGRVIFRKRVGPAKANPFYARGMARAKPAIDAEGAAVGQEVTASIGGTT